MPSRRAGQREWIGLGVLSIACLIYSMDHSVLYLILPAVVADLHPHAAEILWINDIYGFMVAGFLVTMGTLGDRYGRRRVLLLGAAGFGAASVLAAWSTTPAMLIVARALLGIAGATIAPSTLSLVANLFPDARDRNRAIGIWGMAFAIGGLIGPVIGGFLLRYFGWGSVFLINVPAMLVLLTAGPFLLPEFTTRAAGRLDLPSVVLSLVAVLTCIYGIKQVAADGVSLPGGVAILAGLALGVIFVQRQSWLADPMIDLAFFRLPQFSAALAVNMLGVLFVFGLSLFQSQYLQLVLGLTPLEAGLWTSAPSMVFILMSLQSHRIASRFGPVPTVIGGLVLNALGDLLMGVSAIHHSLFGLLAGHMVVAIGFVPVVLTTTSLIVGSVPAARSGSASALSETGAEFGGALGIALLGSFGAFFYRKYMRAVDTGTVPANHVPIVRGSLAGAVHTAQHVLKGLPTPWLTEARGAFTQAYFLTTVIAAACLLLLAVLAGRALGQQPACDVTGEDPQALCG
nr:MFS transporter [uncultured Gellertiella sp.]